MEARSGSGPDTVRVEFSKWDGTRHWHYDMDRLGSDTHGTWLGTAPGTTVRRGDEPPKEHPYGFVTLVPERAWWMAIWNRGGHSRFEIYVDVCTPPEWSGATVRMADLDLDVVRYRSGEVAVLDEDEFTEHASEYGYPERVVDMARTTAAALVLAIGSRREPFGEAARTWLDRVTP